MRTHLKKLEEIADSQHGYFTARQAKSCGFEKRLHSYHCKAGNWLKVSTGLFRLKGFADSMEADFTRFSLWSRNQKDQPQGIISHDSALAFHNLGKYNPDKIHLTVSGRFQKKIPDGVIIHNTTLTLSAIESRDSFMVTRLGQTLSDMRRKLEEKGEWHSTIEQLTESGRLNTQDRIKLGLASPATTSTSNASAIKNNDENRISDDNHENQQAAADSLTNDSDSIAQGVWQMIFNRSEPGRRRSRAGFTLVELLVVIAIISILAAMLMPALGKAMDNARQIACQNNLKQMGTAFGMYVGDYNGHYTSYYISGTNNWRVNLANPYLGFDATGSDLNAIFWKQSTVFTCQSGYQFSKEHGTLTHQMYGMNRNDGSRVTVNNRPYASETALAADGSLYLSGPYWRHHIDYNALPDPVHSGGINMLYFDYHVKRLNYSAVPAEVTSAEGTLFWKGTR